ncbi:MAG: exonuclease SbcCD subunit D [Lachnospiraceae bacterium]|mgnify:FL=1|nr:exonuclease SbcCD subunit D [Lachnospiraceae bacterium]
MKLLHISDLHIGKRVNEFSMIEDQKYILRQILTIADQQQADGVMIAGDIYDKPVPSAEAVQVFDWFLTELADRGKKVYAVSGNHDSAERIAFGAQLMRGRGVYVSPVYRGETAKYTLTDAYGEMNIYLLPFIKPAVVRHALEGLTDTDADFMQEEVLSDAAEKEKPSKVLLGSCYETEKSSEVSSESCYETEKPSKVSSESCYEKEKPSKVSPESYYDAVKIAIERMNVDTSKRNILIAHQFVTGAGRCDSEEVSVGGLDNVESEVFDAFDYVALGHIHSPQFIKRETLRYCGTPLKYSFSEADQEKSVTVVEFAEKGNIQLSTVPLVPLRDMRRIRGTYLEVTARTFYQEFNTEDYVQVTLTDEEDIPDGLQKLRIIYPNLMRLEYDNSRTKQSHMIERAEDIEQKSEQELFAEFYELQNNQPMNAEQAAFVAQLIAACKEQDK